MSGDENFLARWSRRKRGATPKSLDQAKPAAADHGTEPGPPGEAPSVDPTTLPPIESISAGSDIRAFLAAGVPADLTRAALRRAWSADPTIRDFIGLSENSWDFTAPGGVPGFGGITEDEVRRLLERLTGEPESADPTRAAAETVVADQPAALVSPQAQSANGQDGSTVPNSSPPPGQDDAAMRHETKLREPHPSLPRRGHGGALPK